MINLDDLAMLARDYEQYPDCDSSQRHFHASASPDVVLALVRIARFAEDYMYTGCQDSADELEKALKEISNG